MMLGDDMIRSFFVKEVGTPRGRGSQRCTKSAFLCDGTAGIPHNAFSTFALES